VQHHACAAAVHITAPSVCSFVPTSGLLPHTKPSLTHSLQSAMSALRDLVTGSDACAPSGAAGTNAVGALVNNLLGGASKVQEQLREVSWASRSLLSHHAPVLHCCVAPSALLRPEKHHTAAARSASIARRWARSAKHHAAPC
jgi:hypothetical protein